MILSQCYKAIEDENNMISGCRVDVDVLNKRGCRRGIDISLDQVPVQIISDN